MSFRNPHSDVFPVGCHWLGEPQQSLSYVKTPSASGASAHRRCRVAFSHTCRSLTIHHQRALSHTPHWLRSRSSATRMDACIALAQPVAPAHYAIVSHRVRGAHNKNPGPPPVAALSGSPRGNHFTRPQSVEPTTHPSQRPPAETETSRHVHAARPFKSYSFLGMPSSGLTRSSENVAHSAKRRPYQSPRVEPRRAWRAVAQPWVARPTTFCFVSIDSSPKGTTLNRERTVGPNPRRLRRTN
jgi:hypothetical protein